MKQIIKKEDKAVSPIIATIIDGEGGVDVVSALFVDISFNIIDVSDTFPQLGGLVLEALFVSDIDVVGERYFKLPLIEYPISFALRPFPFSPRPVIKPLAGEFPRFIEPVYDPLKTCSTTLDIDTFPDILFTDIE